MKFKRVIFILAIILMVFSIFFVIKYSGFSIQNTISQVTVDQGIIVLYDEFNGSTTDFLYLNDTELESIENMILENTNYGKIIFSEIINLTENTENNIIDLDSNVNISFNKIGINTTNLTSLRKNATLYLYNLTFSNPRILRNGSICPSSICQIINYFPSTGTLIFNVSNFTTYSAEETPGVEIPPSGGGAVRVSDFSLDRDLIKISLKQGETKREEIIIKNIGNTRLNLTIESSLKQFMAISEESFLLNAGETKTINIDFFAKENEIPDAYIGRILVEGDGITKAINIIIEIKEKKPIFDVSVDVKTKEVNAGGEVEANINIVNLGDLENIDVLVYYAIKDFQQNILSFKEESIFIRNDANITRKLRVPASAPFGAYVFYSKISYGNISASGADVFMVSEKIRLFNLILIILVIILAILIYLIKKRNKKA